MMKGEDGRMALGVVAVAGLIIALAGALLDFYSGYLMMSGLASGAGTMGEMGMSPYAPSGVAWGAAVFVLGLVVLASAAISVSSFGAGRSKMFGLLMFVYGVIMLGIGALMQGGTSALAHSMSLVGLGMVGVGILMVANGLLMAMRSRPTTTVMTK